MISSISLVSTSLQKHFIGYSKIDFPVKNDQLNQSIAFSGGNNSQKISDYHNYHC